MRRGIVWCLAFTLAPAVAVSAPQLEWRMVWVWAVGDRSDAEVVRLAQSLGFNAVQARSPAMVEECHRAGMEAVASLWFGSAPDAFAQQILPEEEARFRKQKQSPESESRYQGGGEPVTPGEVSDLKPWCLDRPEALRWGTAQIDRCLSDGYDGIAFDAIGFQNFRACYCPVSRARHEAYRRAHPGCSQREAVRRSSEESLIAFYQSLIAYARARKPGIRLTCHIYPHFAPNPFYGNRLDLDTCGQTVSWFFLPHWSPQKIRRYCQRVVRGQNRYHARSVGAPFLGIYTMPPFERHRKTPERVRQELRWVKQSGARAIQMAELGHLANDPAIAGVVREELTGGFTPVKRP